MNNHFSCMAYAPLKHFEDYPHVHFIHEFSRMRYLTRGWVETVGLPPGFAANNAEHAFNATTIGIVIGSMENLPDKDIHAIAFSTWLHDTPELRVRDHTPTSKPYVKVFEKKAFKALFQYMPQPLRRLATKTFDNYKKRASIVDRIVKSADIIDTVRECIEWQAKGVNYLDHIPDRIQQKRQRIIELGVPSALVVFDDLLRTGSNYLWFHTLRGPSTFTTNSYGK